LASQDDLIEIINPTHVAAFEHPLYLGCSFVKKDLCFAGSFTLVHANLLYRMLLVFSCGLDKQSLGLLGRRADEYTQILYNKVIFLSYYLANLEALRKGLRVGFVCSPTHIL
jgi:hypothetical protein